MFHFNYTGQGHSLASSPLHSRRKGDNSKVVMAVFTFSFFAAFFMHCVGKAQGLLFLHTWYFFSKYIIESQRKYKKSHHSLQTSLFQIIPSDKINATEYEVTALMGHPLLRWHTVLHTLNVTPIAYCTFRQFSLRLFFPEATVFYRGNDGWELTWRLVGRYAVLRGSKKLSVKCVYSQRAAMALANSFSCFHDANPSHLVKWTI